MKRHSKRWYEKDEFLKAFMNLMQDLPIEVQCELAVEIIIKSSEMIDRDYSKMAQEVALFNPKDYKRWYDKNPNIHLAIESLRDLTPSERDIIVKEFSAKILSSYPCEVREIEEKLK